MPPKTRSGAKVRRKVKKNVAVGQAHIKSTFNNTIVTITDPTGAVISWASAGTVETIDPHRAETRWHIDGLGDRWQRRQTSAVGVEKASTSSPVAEVTDLRGGHYSTVTDFARLRGLSTS